jgi:hypothetical protein
MSLLLLAFSPVALAGDYVDVWVTTAFEDSNLRAGPESQSPSANFVQRGNSTFFENYESMTTDDISRAELVLYRADDSHFEGWGTEAAFVLRYTPYLNPDNTKPGVDLRDDGSYVRIIRDLPGEKHNISLTGYAVDAGRFRLGYSYDLTWGGREIYAFTTGAAPGARLQWQKGGNYVFAGAKTTIGDTIDPDTELVNNQTYYGALGGAGVMLGDLFKLEGGLGSFQQGQIKNVDDATSELYGELIVAAGFSGQVAFRSTADLNFIESADLKLYRNGPDHVKDSYISHKRLDGFGVLVQAEANRLSHNLLSPTDSNKTVKENALSGDVQTLLVYNTTSLGVDLVYKDLPYILFNVPGLTSGVALSPDLKATPQLYTRFKVEHFFPDAHMAPSLGVGLMKPATYQTSDGIFVVYNERDKERVPDGQQAAAILSGVAGLQVDMSKSVVLVGEVLYTVDNNLSDYVATVDENGEPSGAGERIPAIDEERKALGMNLMMRARF